MLLSTLVRGGWVCSEQWLTQRRVTCVRAENKGCWELTKGPSLLTPPCQGLRDSGEEEAGWLKSWSLGKTEECCLPDVSWLLYLWTRGGCGYLHKTCKHGGSQHSSMDGRTHKAPLLRGSYWLLMAFFFKDVAAGRLPMSQWMVF